MKIVLVRHGQASDSPVDSERKLTEQGKKESHIVGKYLKNLNWNFKEILSSPLLRAKETADEIQNFLKVEISLKEVLKPNQGPRHFENLLLNYDNNDSLILVLHMPDIAEITSRLLKMPISSLYFSTGSAIGINIDIQRWENILVFLYQPNYLME